MTWVLVAIGVLVGAAEWGFPGAITLGLKGPRGRRSARARIFVH